MKKLLLRWLASTLAVLCTAYLVRGIHVGQGSEGFVNALVGSLLLGFLNSLIRPILVVLSCPLIIASLGIFWFIINALMLLWASSWARAFGFSFVVEGWGAALIGSILITFLNFVIGGFLLSFVKEDDA